MQKKVLFIHFRTGERDGVSLEIEKRADIFRKLGHKVYYITGFDPRYKKDKNIFAVPEIDIKRRLPLFLRETFFDERILDKTLAWLLYQAEEEKIYTRVTKILKDINPDLIFVHNVLSLAYHMPASTAILKALDVHQSKTVVVHHDFWWERGFFKVPRYIFLKDLLEHMPPYRHYIIKHQVINSLAQQDLFNKRDILAEKIGDSFEFDKPVPRIDDFNKDFLEHFGIDQNDLVLLQATRIVPRKAIENAICFAAVLQKQLQKTDGFKFGKKYITKDSKVVIIMPNIADVDTATYIHQLNVLAQQLQVKILIINDDVGMMRFKEGIYKKYSFWECYTFADLVTYTSYWEGYGNQLLEAFWAKKIPLIFEYSVYKKDIAHEGYNVISLGDMMQEKNGLNFVPQDKIEKAAKEAFMLLQDEKKYYQMVEENFNTARKHHDTSILARDLQALISFV